MAIDRNAKISLGLLALAAVVVGGYIAYSSSNGDSSATKKTKKRKKVKKGTAAAAAAAAASSSSAASSEAEKLRTEGNKMFQKGDFQEAAKLYTRSIEMAKSTDVDHVAKCYGNRAYCYIKMEDYDQGIKDCTSALEYDSQYTKALQRRAGAYEHIEEWEKALDDYLVLMQIFSPTGNQSAESITKAQQDGMASIDRVLQHVATTKAKKVIENKKGEFANKSIVKVYLATFREKTSDKSIQELESDQDSIEKKLLLAQKYMIDECNLEKAHELYIEVLKSDADNFKAVVGNATMLHLCGKIDECLGAFEKAMSIDSKNVNMLVKYANALLYCTKIERAVQLLTQALDIDPKNPVIAFHLGEACTVQGKHNEAIAFYDSCIKYDPKHYEGYNHKGLAYMAVMDSLGEMIFTQPQIITDANDTFEQALKIRPDDVEAYNNYGLFLRLIQRNDQATQQFDLALKKDPNNATAYTRKGFMCLQVENDVNKAMEFFEKAIKLDQYHIEAYCNRAITFLTMNKIQEAIDCYDKAVEFSSVLSLDLPRIFYFRETAIMQQQFQTLMSEKEALENSS